MAPTNAEPDKISPTVEARLIRQEHRMLSVFTNFFGRKRWGEDDPRRRAAVLAFALYFVPFGGSGGGLGVGAMAVLGIVIAMQANELFTEQNEKIDEQNELVGEQNAAVLGELELTRDQFDSERERTRLARRTELLAWIYECQEPGTGTGSGEDRVCTLSAHPRTRQEAVCEYVSLERSRSARPDLRYADLRSLSLRCNLSKSILIGTDLRHADLEHADLRDADLTDADLRQAGLRDASLNGADLTVADLGDATLTGVDLRRAILLETNLEHAHLTAADLRGVDLQDVSLREAYLGEANLSGANLWGPTEARYWQTYCPCGEHLSTVNEPESCEGHMEPRPHQPDP